MKWLLPPRVKVLEALGCVADGRIELQPSAEVDLNGKPLCNVAKVFSSSKGKFYTVSWDSKKNAVMSNDNGSYWRGYLGYPAIAMLMLKGVLPYDERLGESLKGIAWKEINQKHGNDFALTEKEVIGIAAGKGVTKGELESYVEMIMRAIEKLDLSHLGQKTKPPQGY